jgi:hypothetical protein
MSTQVYVLVEIEDNEVISSQVFVNDLDAAETALQAAIDDKDSELTAEDNVDYSEHLATYYIEGVDKYTIQLVTVG